jgi:hypothetical protein
MKANPKDHKRFHKIVSVIVGRSSPSTANSMAAEDQAEAVGQEGKKRVLKPRDISEKAFK